MKWILLALLIPATGFSMSCDELGTSIEGLEKQLMKAHSKDLCDSRQDKSDPVDCYSLATLETRLRELENARGLLEGINKLKETIQSQKESLRLNTKTRNRAALGLADAIVTAQSLELLVNTANGDHNILTDMKSGISNGTIDENNFVSKLQYFCKRRPTVDGASAPADACGNKFAPSKNALKEMTEVLKSVPVDQSKIDTWKAALAIKKTGVAAGESDVYSFSQMRTDAELNDADLPASFSRGAISALLDLPDFEDKITDFGFMRDIKEGKENAVKRDKFKFLVEDLADRQKLELESRISTAYSTYKNQLSPVPAAEICGLAKSDYNKALECMDSIRSGLANMDPATASTSKAELERLLTAMDISKKYLSSIQDKTPDCLKAIDASFNPASTDADVAACSGMITQDLAEVDNDINQLKNGRNKILEEQKNIVSMRDHAVKKLRDDCSPNKTESTIMTCDSALITSMTPEMQQLTAGMMEISLTLVKPADAKEEINTVAACEYFNEDHKTESLESFRLCEDLKTIPAPKVSEARTNRNEPVRRGTDPEGRERHPFWEGVSAGLPGLASQMAYNNMASMYQPISPYTLYPTNYGLGVGGTGYSSLPAYYLYPGLNYSPTPGATYYSSFLPGVTNYTPAASTAPASTTSFFNFSY